MSDFLCKSSLPANLILAKYLINQRLGGQGENLKIAFTQKIVQAREGELKNNGKLAQVDSYNGGSVANPTKQFTQKFHYDPVGNLKRKPKRGATTINKLINRRSITTVSAIAI